MRMGRLFDSSRRYRSALLVELCVELDRPVSLFRSKAGGYVWVGAVLMMGDWRLCAKAAELSG